MTDAGCPIKGDFCKRVVLANVPSFWFWGPGMSKVIAFVCQGSTAGNGFRERQSWYRGTSAKTTLLETILLRTPDSVGGRRGIPLHLKPVKIRPVGRNLPHFAIRTAPGENAENADCLSSPTENRGLRRSAARKHGKFGKSRRLKRGNADDWP